MLMKTLTSLFSSSRLNDMIHSQKMQLEVTDSEAAGKEQQPQT